MSDAACSQPNCGKPAHARGMCPMHYARFRKTGDPTRTKYPPLAERFWAQVDKTQGECWLCIGTPKEGGYGVLSVTGGWPRLAHRLSYELEHGMGSAAGLMVCHSCDNPPCVNPAHLFLGTNLDNVRDMQAKGRVSRVTRVAGASHPQAKLNDAEVTAIKRQRAAGAKVGDLAAKYGVSASVVTRITNGRAWRHLQEQT